MFAATGWAQRSSQPLITQAVDDTKLTVLRGNTYPMAKKQFDRGAAPASMPVHRMLLVLQRSPLQEHSLVTLLDSQQDKSSANYHKWLTPDQFGQQFGPSDSDVQTVTAWLQSHGFQITQVSKGRNIIEFDGTAGQVQQAFHTSIHSYLVNGEQHWANASDPQIPAALAPVIAGPVSLHNFFPKPQNRFGGIFSKSKTSPKLTPVNPQFTFPGCGGDCFAVVPYDFATIYNVLPLWNAGVDGTGQTIAIVGQTNINIQDVRDFRALFGLPAKDPNIILNGPDPGINGDEGEADIDVQWSGAVAKNATIDFVVSAGTETTAGIDLSAEYIIDNNLAPVMSESYGACELAFGTAGNAYYSTLWEQAAAQGITVMISTGDSGSAGCDVNTGTAAQFGLAVNGIASTPFNVAVGGTDFDDFSNPQNYWGFANDPTTQASALSYIPETTWNDSCTNGLLASLGYSSNAEANCNNSTLISFGLSQAIGGSGGASTCTTNSQQLGTCSGGYAKPSWQFGTGVPADGKRDLPDVSLFASNGFVGNYYIVCQSDLSPSGMCDVSSAATDLAGYGGTSVASPAFAGIMALVNQNNGRQGNANYVLYKLAATQTASSCNSSNGSAPSCIFNDVTSGTIAMPCLKGSTNCTTSVSSDTYGVLSGYPTTAGYDLATGLGTVNALNLVNNWNSVTFTPSTTTLSLTPTTLNHGQSVSATITVSPIPTLATASVSLLANTGHGIAAFTLSGGHVTGSTSALPGGTYTVHAHFAGDGSNASSDSAPVSVTVAKENSTSALSMITFNSQGQIVNQHATTAVYGSPYILRADVTASSGVPCVNCPSGTLNLTDNASALDGGSLLLNNQGYAEDLLVQFPGGNNAVVANYPGDSSFNSSSANATYIITPASTSMTTVSVTPTSASSGVPFTVTTTILTSSSGAGPTGAVTFLGNGTPLTGTVTYSPVAGSINGPASTLASLTTSLSTAGNYALTATYAGDLNYTGSSASGPTLPVDSDFTPTLSAPSLTIASPGASGQLTLTIAGQSAYSGTVNFTPTSCSGLPTGATCSFSPASVTGSGTTTVTVSTKAATAERRAGLTGFGWSMGGLGTMAFGFVLIGGEKRRRWSILLGLTVVGLLLFLPACGGGGSGGGGTPGTPMGMSTVTVTATSGGLSHGTTFMLIVQ
jgi:hypothetical protein